MNYRVVKLEPRRDGLLVFITIYNFIAMCVATAHPEDYVATAAYHDRSDMYTTAFINVSRKTGNGYTWERTDDGRYGGGYIGPAFGLVVHVTSDDNEDDHTGCRLPFVTSRKDNRELPPPGEAWIALIKRGECSFEDKVDNAYKSNAAGVLVYNNMDSATLDKMKLSTDNGRNISAVFTYKWKGERIAELIENNSKVYMHITIGGHTTSRPAINRTSVFFVSITFVVLMLISLAWLIFYYVQRFRYLHAKDLLSRRLCNAAKKALSKIPTKSIKADDKEVQGDGECCAICIEPYKVLEVLRILPCGHEFHKSCIDPWLLEQRTCPMCKMDILKYYGFVFTGSQESILHMDTEDAVLNSGNDGSSRRSGGGGSGSGGGGISPLPQIRADHQRSFDSSTEAEDNNSSRSSSPDEMTLTLSNRHVLSARQDLCVSCKATAAAAVLVNENDDDDYEENLPTSVQ